MVVPEAAIVPEPEGAEYHTGRGGAGNEHHQAPEGTDKKSPTGLADKLKGKILGIFKK